MDKDVVTNKFFFVYKFALYDEDNQFVQYERGVDRICDLEILPDLNETQPGAQESYLLADRRFHQSQPAKSLVKRCELDHLWERFTATFSVSYPLEA